MAASRLDRSGFLQPDFVVHAGEEQFTLPAPAVRIQRNGIEFRSPTSFPLWTEMTIALQAPGWADPFECTGVVVACDGNRHRGYFVSVLFVNLSRRSQDQIGLLAQAELA
jgi:hypothetical protein